MSEAKKTEINLQERKHERFWVVSIDPYYEPGNKRRGHRGRVDAHSSIEFGGDHWEPAKVSWYSIGAVDVEEAEAFAKAVSIAIEHARKMDAEHGLRIVPTSRELVVTIEICKWCNSPRPIEVSGAENIPPGKHEVKMQLSHGMCVPCGTRMSDGIEKGGMSQVDTIKGHDATKGKP